jgi:acetylornithine deacetylase/succinyl-diaminopimelate desuccinylase-like protein
MEQFPKKMCIQWMESHEKTVLKDFFHFLHFRSISTDPIYQKDCLQTADWLKIYLEQMGAQVEILQSSGKPAVLAQFLKDPSFPTVLLYHHYDVQPVDPIDLWKTDPFTPVLKEGKVYARGASDNKGQCFFSITALKALQEFLKEDPLWDLPLNIKLFIEGEEESGGVGTSEILQAHAEKLWADFLCVVDFDIPSKDTPALSLGYRGIVTMEIECMNSSTDLHSGSHGGIALNPNRILTTILSKLWDEQGKVTIPHFYDKVRSLSKEELAGLDFSFDAEKYRKEFGVGAFCPEEGRNPKETSVLYPTAEINGIWGGYTGLGFKTVIPARAHAKVSCRLVPDQDPNEVFQHFVEFLKKHTPKGAEISVKLHHGAKAYRSSGHSFLIQATGKSIEEVFEKSPCKYVLSGGSIPIVGELIEASKAEAVLLGFALETDNVHAPNEHFVWECFQKGFLTMLRLFWELAFTKSKG